jgi:hypothetical protein
MSNARQQMECPAFPPDSSALQTAAKQCAQLLCADDFGGVARSFGYAVALGREPATAISADLAWSLREVGASGLAVNDEPEVTIKYFEPHQQLLAVVECELSTDNDRRILMELVVSCSAGRTHISLEQLSAAA